jgi:gluconokinase
MTVLALDIGSSSVRAQRFDDRAEPDGELRQEKYETNDAEEVAQLVRKVLDGDEPDGASCFGHSLVALDGKGNPLTPILGWRDTRSADAAEWLCRRLDTEAVHARTGAFVHPSFWPAKLAWLAESEPDVFRSAARFVSFSDYALGNDETSLSMASGTGLLDLTTNDWDLELLDTLGLDAARLPPIAEVPVWIDGACSNLGAGCVGRTRAALMIGTSGAVRVLYETERPQPKPGLFVYRLDARRVIEGGALSDGGNLHHWLDETLADGGTPREEHGLTFLPFLGGERSLGWDPARRGTIAGLSFDTTTDDIVQAALEGVCYGFAEIADAMAQIDSFVVTGRALLANPGWVQILADVLGRTLEVSGVAEGSARGAAVLELERLGLPVPEAPISHLVEPRPDRHEIHLQARAEQRALIQSREAS